MVGPGCSTGRVLRQIEGGTSHSPSTVVAIINMFPKPLLETHPIRVPAFLQTGTHSGELTWNGTPTWAFTDCHVDLGMSNISLHVDKCSKVWVLWPPTPANNKLFYSAKQEATRRSELNVWEMIGGQLEGGQIAIADRTTGLFIPQGWIHLVYTLRGGYLTSYTYSCASEIPKFIECAGMELVVLEKDEVKAYAPTIQFLFSSIANELRSNDRVMLYAMIGHWIRVVDMVDAGLVGQKHKYPPATRLHISGLLSVLEKERKLDLGQDCPCGMHQSGANIFRHLVIHKPLL